MFDYQRLSKEYYEYMGKSSVWTFSDACVLLTSFELEVAGKFGDTDELHEISRRNIMVSDSLTALEHDFKDTHWKWFMTLNKALSGGHVPFVNVPDGEEDMPPLDIPEGCGIPVQGCGVFFRDLLLQYLEDSSALSSSGIDLENLNDYLLGDGKAPSKYQDTKLRDYFSEQAKKRHDSVKDLKKGLVDFLLSDLAGGCTCTKKQAVDRIYKGKYDQDEAVLKKKTAYGLLMFSRKVSEAIKQIEKNEKSGLNRHENTEGFSYDKIPACKKHS